jgi:hypothetical protein
MFPTVIINNIAEHLSGSVFPMPQCMMNCDSQSGADYRITSFFFQVELAT